MFINSILKPLPVHSEKLPKVALTNNFKTYEISEERITLLPQETRGSRADFVTVQYTVPNGGRPYQDKPIFTFPREATPILSQMREDGFKAYIVEFNEDHHHLKFINQKSATNHLTFHIKTPEWMTDYLSKATLLDKAEARSGIYTYAGQQEWLIEQHGSTFVTYQMSNENTAKQDPSAPMSCPAWVNSSTLNPTRRSRLIPKKTTLSL